MANAVTAVRDLLTQMGNGGVVKVLYFFYPEPLQDLGGLKAKLDILKTSDGECGEFEYKTRVLLA